MCDFRISRTFRAMILCLLLGPLGCQRSESVIAKNSDSDVVAKPRDPEASLALQLDGRHHQLITAIAISPDEKLLLVGGYNQVGIYALSDFKKQGVTKPNGLKESIGHCEAIIFSPDGKSFVIHGHHGHSEWDAATGLRVPEPIPFTTHVATFDWRSRMEARRVSPNQSTKLVVKEVRLPNQPGVVEVRDTAPPEALRFELKHQDSVSDTLFSPDGKWIVTASGKPHSLGARGRFQVWNAQTGELLIEKDQGAQVTSIAFTADGKSLLTAQNFDVKKWAFDVLLQR